MASSAQRKVISPKSVIFSYGFRPFFLCASVWAVVAMSVWILVLSGRLVLPTTLDPVSWHAHEFLFGYLGAVIAGFILTAVPNWTARPAITGWPLARLFVLWLAGRLAIATSAHLPSLVLVITDLSFQLMLCTMVARELISARNWRNLIFVCLLCGQILGNAVFHWEVLLGEYAAHGAGFRIGLAASVMMIVVMGGRIVPNFTHNWLVSRGDAVRPAPTGMIDKLAILGILFALIFWIIVPEQEITAIALLLSGALHLVRLARWSGHRSGSEPLVWVLHLGYAFIALGAISLGISTLWPSVIGGTAGLHVWMTGAIGIMTVAVMTRATLGHSGRELHAGIGTSAIYYLLVIVVLTRTAVGTLNIHPMSLHMISGIAWLAAFIIFIVIYGPILLSSRVEN